MTIQDAKTVSDEIEKGDIPIESNRRETNKVHYHQLR